MNKTVSCVLILAFCLSLVGTGFGAIVVGNAEFEDEPIELGDFTYNIAPWAYANASGDWPAWIGYGYYGDEPEPVTPIIFTAGCTVFQPLSATYEDGGIYVYSLDVAVYYESDDWEFFLYDATAGDYSTPLVSRASTDPGEAQIDLLTWARKSLTFVATSAEAGHQIGVGFSGWEWTMIDNVALEVPAGACLPDPFDGETDVLVNKTLSWYAGRDPDHPSLPNPALTEHKVYMSSGSPTDPNLVYKASIAATGDTGEYTPDVELIREATYYWRVDERLESDANVVTGDVWMFETVGTIPVIDDATPADALVDAGADVVFTVIAFNPFTSSPDDLGFEWYKASDPNNALSDGADYSGTLTASLTVLDVQEDDNDEGRYYCVVTNTAGNTESNTSRSAGLGIKKMIAHWPLDGNADDATGNGNDGTLMGTPGFADGVMGQAMELDGVDDYVVIDGVADNISTNDITLSAWVKTTDVAGELIACNTAGYGNVAMIDITDGYANLYEGASEAWSTTFVSDGQWHLLTYTRIGSLGSTYVDGALEATHTANFNFSADDRWSIGQEWDDAGPSDFLTGDVDDVRIYNYGLDAYEIANLYIDGKPGDTVCVSYPALDISGPYGEPDCAVNIFDFALMASHWMECNLVPDCI